MLPSGLTSRLTNDSETRKQTLTKTESSETFSLLNDCFLFISSLMVCSCIMIDKKSGLIYERFFRVKPRFLSLHFLLTFFYCQGFDHNNLFLILRQSLDTKNTNTLFSRFLILLLNYLFLRLMRRRIVKKKNKLWDPYISFLISGSQS